MLPPFVDVSQNSATRDRAAESLRMAITAQLQLQRAASRPRLRANGICNTLGRGVTVK
jgi:hypothetical protein